VDYYLNRSWAQMIRAMSTRTGADKQPQKKTIKLNSVQLLTENTAGVVSGENPE
jgi:hypothetical protein